MKAAVDSCRSACF